jgi:hypothetical protein
MTLGSTVFPNIRDWLDDFDLLHMPYIRTLTSDTVLVREMKAALEYRNRSWSDRTGLVSFGCVNVWPHLRDETGFKPVRVGPRLPR